MSFGGKIKKFQTEWNLSDFYSGIEDKKYQEDFLLLQKLLEKFTKKYSMKIHTFHTISDFYLFYQDFEDFIIRFEKLKYYLTFLQTKNIFDEKIFNENEKLEKISNKLVNLIDKSFKKCDENFFDFFEQELLKNQDFYYKMTFFQDLKNYKKGNKIKNYTEINQLTSKILFLENDYSRELQKFYSFEIKESDFIAKSQDIYFSLYENRYKYSKINKYDSVFFEKLEEYHINSNIFNVFMVSCEEFFSSFDFSKIKNYNYFDNNFRISIDDSIVFLEKFFDFLGNFEIKKLFFDMLYSGKIDFSVSNSKRNDNFTASIKNFGSYISLNFDGGIDNVISIVHEFGHSYQAYKSKKQNTLEYQPSPFMSEISAIYFEKKLLDFCLENIKNNLDVEISKIIRDMIYKKFQDSIYFSFLLSNIEFDVYKNKNSVLSDEYFDGILNVQNISKYEFLVTTHIFYSPFYICSYIFATIWANYFSFNDNFYKFEKMCEFGGSLFVEDIFQRIGVNIFDKNIYNSVLEDIFYYKYE